jgi:MinD-like ATPase involved in chromosome partitioning or flagellar assembly
MSMVVLASAKGAPGVTTATVALAGVWPQRVVIAECDPSGGDIAARFGLAPAPGLLSLASQARHQLRAESLRSHLQRLPPGDVPVLMGVQAPEQAVALGRVWGLLPGALAGLGADVLVDCGRLLPDAPTEHLVNAADLTLLIAQPTVEEIAHLEWRLGILEQSGRQTAVVLAGEEPYDRRTVASRLAADGLRAPVLGVLADDPEAASELCGRPRRRRSSALARSYLVRSARELAERLAARLATSPAGVGASPSSPVQEVDRVGTD